MTFNMLLNVVRQETNVIDLQNGSKFLFFIEPTRTECTQLKRIRAIHFANTHCPTNFPNAVKNAFAFSETNKLIFDDFLSFRRIEIETEEKEHSMKDYFGN